MNISSQQAEKLKTALNRIDSKQLDAADFTGKSESIFQQLNEEYDNAFKDTGLDQILNNIAREDEQISEEEIKNLTNMI